MKTQAFAFVVAIIFTQSVIGSEKNKTEFELYLEAQKNRLTSSREILRTSGDSAISKHQHNLSVLKCDQCGSGHTRKKSDEEMMNQALMHFLQLDDADNNIHG